MDTLAYYVTTLTNTFPRHMAISLTYKTYDIDIKVLSSYIYYPILYTRKDDVLKDENQIQITY